MLLIIKLIIILLFLYIFTLFFLSRLFIPFLSLRRTKIPNSIPEGMLKAINNIKKKSKTKRAFLKNSYDFLGKRYYGSFEKTWTHFSQIFMKNVEKIWNKKGFLHCEHQNMLLRIFLIKSRLFSEEDIRIHDMWFTFSIHQYLEINVAEKGKQPEWLPVDPWSKNPGLKFGKRPPVLWRFRKNIIE